MWEFFETKCHQGMPVLIHVSTTGEGEYHGHVFSYSATYDRVVAEEREIRHLRPSSALATDTGHGCFWVVKEFRRLADGDFVCFRAFNINPPLRGPVVKQST